MNIKITVLKSEVKEIVEAHVLSKLPIDVKTVDIYTHDSYGEYVVEIDPKKEEAPVDEGVEVE